LEVVAKVRWGETPAQYVDNANPAFVVVRILWNPSSERVERWNDRFSTGEFTLHSILVASFGEFELAGPNGSTISFENLGVVTMSARFLDCSLQ